MLPCLQGDGTAAIFEGDTSVFTFSMHCEAQPFPHELQRSDLDVALPGGCGDAQYMQVGCIRVTFLIGHLHTHAIFVISAPSCMCLLALSCLPLPSHHGMQALQDVLPPLLQRVQPQLVLYNAGVDVHKDDALGKMALTDAGILARDRFVFVTCAAAGVPVAAAIGGGYNLQDHERIVDRHMLLHRAAAEYWPELARCGMAARRTAPAA